MTGLAQRGADSLRLTDFEPIELSAIQSAKAQKLERRDYAETN